MLIRNMIVGVLWHTVKLQSLIICGACS